MKIAVRLDDITPDMDWERFFKWKALLDQYQVKPLIGVVPDNRDENLKTDVKKNAAAGAPEDFWGYLKELEQDGWCIAMHGYRHIYATDRGGLFPLNNFSEFAGISGDVQREMIREGKRILESKGVHTDIFMAPAHSYDRNTLKALKENGFTGLTDGFGNGPYRMHGLTFYPISFHLGSTLRKKSGCSTMVIHTGTTSDEELKQYESYFQRENIEWIPYGAYLAQPSKQRHFFGRCLEFWMAKGKYLIGKLR